MLLPLLILGVAQAEPSVAIHVEGSRYDSGAEIVASVTNAMGEPIYVPACDTMQVETFDADHGRWIPAAARGCTETKVAVALPEGDHSLTARFETDRFAIVRLVLVFGLRCRAGFALDMAGCEEFRAATSSNLTVTPPPEK